MIIIYVMIKMTKVFPSMIIFMWWEYKASQLELDVSLPAMYWER